MERIFIMQIKKEFGLKLIHFVLSVFTKNQSYHLCRNLGILINPDLIIRWNQIINKACQVDCQKRSPSNRLDLEKELSCVFMLK